MMSAVRPAYARRTHALRLFAFLAACIVPLALPAASRAQVDLFGQNKIQYDLFDWRVLEGPHVRLYHYREEEDLARYALEIAEASYTELSARFGVETEEKVPLVLYNSHQHFEETNLVPGFLPEAVGGFTEFLRGRVALPFMGSYGELRHVIRHEMVHVFQRAKLTEVYRLHRRNDFASTPLWLTEGLAEYWSDAPLPVGQMVLGDLALAQRLPTVGELDLAGSSGALYPVGQSLVAHIASRVGEERLRLLYESLWRSSNFSEALESVTGMKESELTESWHRAVKEQIFPRVAGSPDLETDAERLLARETPARMPVTAPPGPGAPNGELVYLSTHLGHVSVFALPLAAPAKPREVLEGETEERFESLHPGQSRMDVSRDRRIALVAKSGDRDALYLVSLDGGTIAGPYKFERLIALFSPTWSPDGRELVFSSLSWDGMCDLYRFTPETQRLERLTHDRYDDLDPDWSPDGNSIVFTSDRGETGRDGFENLWILDLRTYGLRPLTSGRWNDRSPRWSPAGDLVLCASDRDSISNLYAVNAAGDARPLTRYLTGVLEADWSPDAGSVYLAAFRNSSFGIYRKTLPESVTAALHEFAKRAPAPAAAPAPQSPAGAGWSWPPLPDPPRPVTAYRPDYALDFAQGGISYSLGGIVDEGFQAVLSDALSDRLMLVEIAFTGDTLSELPDRLSLGLFRVNLAHRTHIGYGAFRYVGDYEDERGNPFFERREGVSVVAAYPFSRFHRMEWGFMLAHSDRSDFTSTGTRRRMIGMSSLAWVRDGSSWNATGPNEGDRERIAVGSTMDLTHANPENVNLVADARRYVRLGGPVAYAGRLFAAVSRGSDPELYLLGGSWNLRGYRWNSLIGSRALLSSQELRFPLLAPVSLFSSRALTFPPIQGALFFDAGNAWEAHQKIHALVGSYGLGMRMGLGGFTVVRLDAAWPTDFHRVERNPHWDIFFGWNF